MTATIPQDVALSPKQFTWGRSAKIALALLTAIYCVQYLDRQIVVILIEPIKHEFALSDRQIGLLTGMVFVLPNALMLIPVGILVDRWNRRNLLAIGLFFWSVLTMVGATVGNFAQLALVRAAVGAAEATNNPSSISMVSDLFDRSRRAIAIGVFYSGPAIATLLGFGVMGLVADTWGWRVAFVVAGLPGLLLALILIMGMSEPAREHIPGDVDTSRSPKFGAVIAVIRSQRSLQHMALAIMLSSISISAFNAWMVAFLTRSYGTSLSTVGALVGLAHGAASVIGMIGGAALVVRLSRDDPRRIAMAGAVLTAISGVCMLGMTASPVSGMALVMIAGWALPNGAVYGPVIGAAQSLVLPRMRGFMSSLLVLLMNFIGAGLGPLIVGAISDRIGSANHSLTPALAIVSAFQWWAVAHYVIAMRHIRGDMARIANELRGEIGHAG